MAVTVLILPLRKDDNNEALRYALRTWEEHLLLDGGLRLLTVGDCPPWLESDEHLPGNEHESSQANVWSNILAASEYAAANWHPLLDCVYMNDDFFCMDPVVALPVYRRNKTLRQHIDMYPQWAESNFVRSLDLTGLWLAGVGIPHPLSYDVHRPLLASPGAMSEAMLQWNGGLLGVIPQWRSLYGNLQQIEAVPVADVKLGIEGGNQHSPWVSTSAITWPRYRDVIAARFQKPSRWER